MGGAMRFHGRIFQDDGFWLAEIPILDAMTQGRTRKEAYGMVKDMLETLVDRPGFSVRVDPGSGGDFEVSSSESRALIGLLLRRRRTGAGLSLAEAAARLGVGSRETYARYERGTSAPAIERLNELLRAISPDRDFVLGESRAGQAAMAEQRIPDGAHRE